MEGKIEEIISKEAISAFDDLNAKLAISITGLEKLVARGVEINRALAGNIGIKKFNEETKALDENQKALEQQEKQLITINAKLNATFTETAQKMVEAKLVQGEVNKQMKEQAKEALGLLSAYDKLTKEYNEAAKVAKDLAVQYGAQSKQAQEASKRALELDARLKAADANVGRFNKNVGNYSGALKVLEKALNDVNKKIDEHTKSGKGNEAVVAELRKEQGLLVQLLDNQSAGFKTSTAEIKENTKALQQMAAQGLEGTEAYRLLFKATADLKDETDDLKASIKNAAPDDVAFNAAADAARGLVGVYGLAQSASALFGEENQQLQEVMVKLQAAETALQSIEAVRALFKKENAVLQYMEIGRQKIILAQTYLQTAAESKSIVVRNLAIGAQKALNAVMSVSGGPLLAIIGLITLLTISLASFASSAGKAATDFEKLNASLEANSKLTADAIEAVGKAEEKVVAEMEANFESEKNIRAERGKFRELQIAKLQQQVQKEGQAYEKADNFVRKHINNFDDLSKDEQKQYNEAIKIVDNYNKTQETLFDLERKRDIERINDKKASTEEFVKANQENIDASNTGLSSRGEALQLIINDEKKSYAERIKALQEYQNIQNQIINNQARSAKSQPGLSASEIRVIEANRTAALLSSRRATNKQIDDLNKEQAQREAQAQFDIARIGIETRANAAQQIADNEAASFEDRQQALVDNLKYQEQLITGQKDFELGNKILLESEKEAIDKKAKADTLAAQVDFLNKMNALNRQQIQTRGEINQDNNSAAESEELRQNELAYQEGKKSKERYEEDKILIQEKYADLSLRLTIDTIRKQLALTNLSEAERSRLLAQLADAELSLAENKTKRIEDAEERSYQRRLAKLRTFQQVITNLSGIISEITSISSDRDKAEIENEQTALENRYKAEVAGIEASGLSEEEKADKVQLLDARTQAQKDILAQRQRANDAKRAQQERALSIARIISDTAIAVVTTLGDKSIQPGFLRVPLAVTIGALGAAQLAKVIATPLPKYAHGTEDHPGGLAIVGDGGKHELVVTPDGKMIQTPKVPTVMNIPRHSLVLPDMRMMMEQGILANWRGGSVMQTRQQTMPDNSQAIVRELRSVRSAINRKPIERTRVTQRGISKAVEYGLSFIQYVEENVNFK